MEFVIKYNVISSWKDLNEVDRNLVEQAYEIAQKAYAPYSNFHVGAALLMEDGSVITGNNQENAAFPSGTCAERTALFYAGANYPSKKIKKIVVVAKGDFVSPDSILSPCGSCRQVMLESESRQKEPIEVLLVSQNEKVIHLKSVVDLLPFAFNKVD